MAKPESGGQEKDKTTKPAEATKGQERFSGADHPLAGKDAQQILQKQDKPAENHPQNIFEQMAQTAEKVTKAAQEAVGQGVETTRQVVHDLSKTIQEHGDVAKQIEKSADKIVATAIEQKNTIDKALGRSEAQSKTEAKIINFVYESKKSDTKHAAAALESFVDGNVKSTKSVVEAATQHGDVAKAIEKHADTVVDGLLRVKENVDRLIGRNPASSFNENMLISTTHGVDKSLVKGAVGILSLAERPNDTDVQFLKPISPMVADTLAVARNTADAVGGTWNAASKYLDHVNKVGPQKAGEEALQSGIDWAVHAKPYDWSEKATDIAMLATGVYGAGKTGLSLLGKIRVAGVADATAVGKTIAAGTTGLEATNTIGEVAASTTHAPEATGATRVGEAATTPKSDAAANTTKVDEATKTAASDSTSTAHVEEQHPGKQNKPSTAEPIFDVQESAAQFKDLAMESTKEIQSNLQDILHKGDVAVEQAIDALKAKGSGAQSEKLANQWTSFKETLNKLNANDNLPTKDLQELIQKTAKEGKQKFTEISKTLKKLNENTDLESFKLEPFESLGKEAARVEKYLKELGNVIKENTAMKPNVLHAFRKASECVSEGGQTGAVQKAITDIIKEGSGASSDLLALRQLCKDLKPENCEKIIEGVEQALRFRQLEWTGATKVLEVDQLGQTPAAVKSLFKKVASKDPAIMNMEKTTRDAVLKFIEQSVNGKSYAYKIDAIPGHADHFLVTVVDMSDYEHMAKLYQQEIKAGQEVFGVRHILATKRPDGRTTDLPFLKVVNLKIEGNEGITGMREGLEPRLVDGKRKYEIYDHSKPGDHFIFDEQYNSFCKNTIEYIAEIERLLESAKIGR